MVLLLLAWIDVQVSEHALYTIIPILTCYTLELYTGSENITLSIKAKYVIRQTKHFITLLFRVSKEHIE